MRFAFIHGALDMRCFRMDHGPINLDCQASDKTTLRVSNVIKNSAIGLTPASIISGVISI